MATLPEVCRTLWDRPAMCRRGGAPGSTIGRRVTDVAMGAAADEFVLEEVAFTVREQTNSARRPCVIYQEITFDKPANIECIKFRNYYCASISIKQLTIPLVDAFGTAAKEPDWTAILSSRQLMTDAHYEDDAQHYHTISISEFGACFLKEIPVHALRFYLEQPSPNWRSFGLRDLKCYKRSSNTVVAKPAPGETAFSSIEARLDPDLVARVKDVIVSINEIHRTLGPAMKP